MWLDLKYFMLSPETEIRQRNYSSYCRFWNAGRGRSREALTAGNVRSKTSLIFGKILERCYGVWGAWVRRPLSKVPPSPRACARVRACVRIMRAYACVCVRAHYACALCVRMHAYACARIMRACVCMRMRAVCHKVHRRARKINGVVTVIVTSKIFGVFS